MPRTRLAVGASTLLVALALGLAAVAQVPKDPLKPKGPTASRAEAEGPATTTMYLFLRTGPDENDADILIDLKSALKASMSKYVGDVKLKPVSPTFYDELLSLVDQAAPAAVAAGDVTVRRLPAQGAVYELAIGDGQVLKSLSVKYKSGLTKEYVPEARKEGEEKKAALQLIVPGRYAFAPDAGETPTEYTATVAEIGKPDAPVTAAWPVADKHFVVTLQKFEGNREQLFAKLRDLNVVPTAYEVKRSDDLLFAFASLKSTADSTEGDLVGFDAIGLSVENLKNSKVKRVWAYYPLDEEGMKAALAKFRDPKFNRESLCEELRKTAVPVGAVASIKTDDPPKWYELSLPADKPTGRFFREVKVSNLFDLAAKYRTVGKLIVWEFQEGDSKPQAIPTQHPDAKLGKVTVLERFDANWQAQVKQALERQKKDK